MVFTPSGGDSARSSQPVRFTPPHIYSPLIYFINYLIDVSRHAYRDSDSDDGEDMYTHHHHGFQSSRRENDETEDDDVYLRVDWPWDGRGRYNSWMMEHGGPLLEFCVRGLEGFNMAW